MINYLSDNLDFEGLNDEFISFIQSSEVIDDLIIAYEIPNSSYFAKVADPRTYGMITHDILNRYVHPMALESK